MILRILQGQLSVVLRATGSPQRAQHWDNFQRVLLLVSTLALINIHTGFLTLAVAHVAVALVALVAILIDVRRAPIPPTLAEWNWPEARAMISPSLFFALTPLNFLVLYEAPLLILQWTAGPLAVVTFATTRTFFSAARQLLTPIQLAVQPELTRAFASSDRSQIGAMYRLSESIALIGGPGWETADDWAALFACVVIAFNGVGMLLRALGEAGWHVVAPDMRGYGLTEAPADPRAYTQLHLVGDMVGVLDALSAPQAVIVGHDWGGAVAWSVAFAQPELTERLVILNLPHPRGLIRELKNNPEQRKNSAYAKAFQLPGAAQTLTPEGIAAWVREPEARQQLLEVGAMQRIQVRPGQRALAHAVHAWGIPPAPGVGEGGPVDGDALAPGDRVDFCGDRRAPVDHGAEDIEGQGFDVREFGLHAAAVQTISTRVSGLSRRVSTTARAGKDLGSAHANQASSTCGFSRMSAM